MDGNTIAQPKIGWQTSFHPNSSASPKGPRVD